jgi:signal transduction histidine kinase/ABC-type amino acid transport substrate-binding protein
MKKTYRIYAFSFLIILTTVFTYGKEKDTKTIPASINIIGDNFYPPYEMLGENGEAEGFCVDLIKEVMKQMKMPYTIRLLPRKDIIKEVKKSKANLILELTYTHDRAKTLHFGTIYDYTFKGALYRNEDLPITRLEQLKGKTVVVEKGSYSERLLKETNFALRILPVTNLRDCISLLNNKKCDAVLCNLDICKYITSYNKEFSCSNIGLAPEKFCISSPNEQLLTKIDFIIYDLKKQGIYDKLHEKWFADKKSEYYLQIIYIGIIITFFIFSIFAIFYFLLRNKIKNARQQLIHNQKSLALSLHAGDIGIWGYDINKHLFYNVFCNYFPPGGRPFDIELTMIHPDDAAIFSEAVLAAAHGESPNQSICVRMDHTGRKQWRYIEKEIHSIRNIKGKVVKVIGTHKDVTDNILKQNQIEELLSDHEIIFNHTSVGIQYFDADGYLMKINDAACEIFGIEDKKALLKKRPNLFEYPQMKKYVDKKDIKKDHFIIEEDFDRYQDDKFSMFIKKKGIHYIETYIAPVYDNNNHIINIIVNNSDRTERETLRKKVEEYAFRMKYILKASGVRTWTYNPDTHTNFSTEEYDNIQATEKYDLIRNITDEDKEQVEQLFKEMDSRSIDTFSRQIKFNRIYMDSKITYCTIHGTPFRDKDGNILYYLGLSINITDLIEIQNKLQNEKELAQKADKLKSAFLANVSHEIRTPLNSIIGFSDLLQYTTDEKEKKQFIEIIKTNNDRLLKIIDDVLDLSKIESGTMIINIEPIDIESIFNEIYEVFKHQLADTPIKLIYDRPYESCIIECDRVRFTQVLTNFMTNAKKYTSSGYIKMGYECVNNGIRIFVEDTGQGIPNDKKDFVFDRFEKLNSFVQGTGLGLSICKDISKMFHGKIGVESDQGKGSTFWMWIPAEYKTDTT